MGLGERGKGGRGEGEGGEGRGRGGGEEGRGEGRRGKEGGGRREQNTMIEDRHYHTVSIEGWAARLHHRM